MRDSRPNPRRRITFRDASISTGFFKVARNGTVEIQNGTLTLHTELGLNVAAPLSEVVCKRLVWLARGMYVRLTVSADTYYVRLSPGGGGGLSSVSSEPPLYLDDVKSADRLLQELVQQATD